MKESELNTITLTPEAESRLAIETAVVERRVVDRVRVLGGEVVVPFEREITVTAPVAGQVLAPPTGPIRGTGSTVRRGDAILRLLFLPGGQDLVRAREQVAVATARAGAARREAVRADSLIRDRVITAREHELAVAALAAAEAELRAARARLGMLNAEPPEADSGDLVPMVVTAPRDGVLWEVHVSEGQTVAAAAPLFEVIDLDPAWIRVPVYVGDAAEIARGRQAVVRTLGGDAAERGRAARPIAAPPSADPLAASVDLYFEVSNTDRAFRPHQRVAVSVPLISSEEGLVVPWSAILYDMHGGTWVYTNPTPHTYVRRRVDVQHIVGDIAVLVRGPEPGTRIVSAGAAELFGTEFGTGK